MKVPKPRYHCALARLQAETMDVDAVKRDGWREHRILVVSEDDERLDFVERELVRRLGERLFGPGGERG